MSKNNPNIAFFLAPHYHPGIHTRITVPWKTAFNFSADHIGCVFDAPDSPVPHREYWILEHILCLQGGSPCEIEIRFLRMLRVDPRRVKRVFPVPASAYRGSLCISPLPDTFDLIFPVEDD